MAVLVSVIVPIYNVEKYLDECVQSILCQTYKNLEIILVDDGSTDQCGKICDRYANEDSRIKVVHKENGGLSDARNAGMKIAQGKYIYFCDSDDYLHKECVEKLLHNAQQNESEVVFFNAKAFCDEDYVSDCGDYSRKGDYKLNTGVEVAFRQLILDEYKPCAYMSFYLKEFIDKNNLEFYKGIISEDELFSFYVYHYAQKVSYCKEELYFRRLRTGSIMTSKKNEKRRFESYSIIYNEIRRFQVEESKICKLTYCEFIDRIAKSTLLIYRLLDENVKKEYKSIYDSIIDDIIKNHGFGDISLVVRIRCWKLGVAISGVRKYIRKRYYA